MTEISYQSRVWKHALHPVLWHASGTCFVGALFTDIAYWRTAEMMWSDFSAWLLTVGLVAGALSAIAFFIDWMTGRLVGAYAITWPYLIGNVIVLVMSLFNALIHSRDGWTSVMPTGLILSASAVVILIVSGLASRTILFRRHRRIVA